MRDATLADLPALLELENACFPPAQAYTRYEYHDALARARAVNLLVEEQRAIIAFIGAFHHRARRLGHVFTLNVHPTARRSGQARRLLQACEERLRALGMTRVALEVNVENEAAIGLYASAGYVRGERLVDYYVGYPVNDAWRYERPL